MPYLSECLNANLVLPENVKKIFDKWIDEVLPISSESNKKAKEHPLGLSYKTDLRETGGLAWFNADDITLKDAKNDKGFNEGLAYPIMSQVERENILDKYYETLQNVDYRKMDFSCLTGEDNTAKLENGLTVSENDFLTYTLHMMLNQNTGTKAKENPDYYINRYQNLTPKEAYKAELNEEYLAMNKNGLLFYVFMKNGYALDLGGKDNGNVDRFNNCINIDGRDKGYFVYSSQTQEIMEQLYAFRMAKVNGEENVPEPVIKFQPHNKWDLGAIDRVIKAFSTGKDYTDKDYSTVTDIFNAVTNHMNAGLDLEKDTFDNLFIDGKLAKAVYEKDAPKNMNHRQEIAFYYSKFLKDLFSGEHYVETRIRYMDNDGKMKAQLMTFEPDLTLIAQRERVEKHGWFRRTFFDWGPFAIKTCKTKQDKLKRNNTLNAITERHQKIENTSHILSKTNDKPNDIYLNFKPKVLEKMNKVKDITLPDFRIWLEDKVAKNKEKGVDYRENIVNNASALMKNDINTVPNTLFMVTAYKFGVGSALSILDRLSKSCEEGKEKSLVTKNQLNQIAQADISKGLPEITTDKNINSIINQSLTYYFRNGGLNHPRGTMLLNLVEKLSLNSEQHGFVEALQKLNEPAKLLNEKCGELAEAFVKDPNAKISEEDMKYIHDRYIETKINKLICGRLEKYVNNNDITSSSLSSKDFSLITYYFRDNKKAYNNLVEQVKSEFKESFFEDNQLKNVLFEIYKGTNEIPRNLRTSMENALQGVKKQVDEPQAVAAKVNEKTVLEVKNPVNNGVAPV